MSTYEFPTPSMLKAKVEENLSSVTLKALQELERNASRAASKSTDPSVRLETSLPHQYSKVMEFVTKEVRKSGWALQHQYIKGFDQRDQDYIKVVLTPLPADIEG